MTDKTAISRGVVLAGGTSTRYGSTEEDKALSRIDSKSCLVRVLDTLRRATEPPPVVVVRTPDQRARYAAIVDTIEVEFTFDSSRFEGPLSGIVGAAVETETPWLFCCGCDMPLLARAAIRWMLQRLAHRADVGDERVDAVAIEQSDGTLEPLHTLYRRESVLEVTESIPRAAGLQALLSELDGVYTISSRSIPDSVPLSRSKTNVNTREDLEHVRSQLIE
ncbi:molybdenum cofactor guanylyltransferase (plasmid) [Haloplanus ruber]|uniref:Molybdenum cofactor guanylyltransferase n=1 Tax=Haloplanus ruber TaxID=869892 RepID=A0ABD6CU65_9EURY|nr:molybdenum cofactor guanylyltransferase [Haloplanus ruber]